MQGGRFRTTTWATWSQRFNRFGEDAISYVGQSLL